MQSYEHFSSQDFVADDAFIKWVTDPTEASDAFWQQWLGQHPHKRPVVDEAAGIVRKLAVQQDFFAEEELQANWERIKQKTTAEKPVYTEKTVVRPLSYGRWLAAASVVVFLVAGLGLWQHTRPVSYNTTYGEIKTIALPDGSEVTLNGNSRISFVRGIFSRTLDLDGEALLKVNKEKTLGKPVSFSVRAGRVAVHVLGTVFNVNHRRQHVEVMLAEGKVRLEASGAQMLLDPGQKATLAANGSALVKSEASAGNTTSWLRRELVYEGATLQSIFEEMEDSFGITTRVSQPEILKKRFTGLVATDSIQNFYSQLGEIYHLQVQPVKGGFLLK
ncbi:FecR family protein [Dyadobacter soli]|uniref:FecR family protein n=1 Tax=Dyadobacter soli TaxID=659014 RepID=A0A1G8CY04_9BACT|nr:FecR domain-containing protein [Dyadobacter soli]SDH50388.1 FecR family protein [Dyadobacter soli]